MTFNYTSISLNEYPGEIALVLYTPKCNLECPWCFNGSLIDKEPLTFKQMKDAIDEHRDFITAVVITGGEPYCNPNLYRILRYISDNGLKVKINTNGIKRLKTKFLYDNIFYVDYLHISLKGFLTGEENFLGWMMPHGRKQEFSLVYSPTLWPDSLLEKLATNFKKHIKFCDIFTLSQIRVGECLDECYNNCSVPTREDCINAIAFFKDLPAKRFIIETYEFGREDVSHIIKTK